MNTCQRKISLKRNPPCSLLQISLETCLRDSKLMLTTMQAAKARCLHNSVLWILFCIGIHVPCNTTLKDKTAFLKHSMPFIKAIGVPFLSSFGARCTSYGTECMYEARTVTTHGDYLSHFLSLIYFKKRELRAL